MDCPFFSCRCVSQACVVIGTVVAWARCDRIPDGWETCNSQASKCPDLSGKFIMGMSESNYPAGTSGGSFGHTHGVSSVKATVHGHQLTVNQMPSHDHNDGVYDKLLANGHSIILGRDYWVLPNVPDAKQIKNVGGNEPHAHGASLSGRTENESSLPPYHVMCFIMKL